MGEVIRVRTKKGEKLLDIGEAEHAQIVIAGVCHEIDGPDVLAMFDAYLDAKPQRQTPRGLPQTNR